MADEIPLLRTSERGDFKCPWLWYHHWVLGISPVRLPTWGVFGSALHRGLQVYYPPGVRRGNIGDACDAFLEYLDGEIRKIGVDIFEEEYERAERKAQEDNKSIKLVPAHELGPIMLQEYAQYYGPDKDWEVIHTEQPFQITVPTPNHTGALVIYAGTWDALMRHRRTKRYWLWDHKGPKTLPKAETLEMNDQAGSYLWVAKEVLLHLGVFTARDVIDGIVFNYLKKALPDPRPVNAAGESLNQDGSVSLKQPAPRFLRYESFRGPAQKVMQARRVQDIAIHMQDMRDGTTPVYKNVTHECPRCILFDMCSAHEAGDDWELIRDELYVVRDPYADHREAMHARGGIEL